MGKFFTMKFNLDSDELYSPDELRLQKQLQMSLKFHHREIFRQIPKEIALQAMNQAWNNSQTQDQFK
jgi:hypothetical protein